MLENERFKRIGIWVVLIACLSFALIPFAYAFVQSLKEGFDLFIYGDKVIPFLQFRPSLASYKDMFTYFPFGQYFLTTVIGALGAAFIATPCAVFAAYSFGRLQYPGKNLLFLISVTAFFIPFVLLAIPLYVLMSDLRLINTYPGLILAFTTVTLPYNIWLLRGFFEELPANLEEAAMVYGCTPWKAFYKVILPLCLPAVFSVFLLAFMLGWHDFVLAYMIGQDTQHFTISVGIMSLKSELATKMLYVMMSGSFLAMLIPLIVYASLQRFLIEGIKVE